jgi:hypothetical protein
MAGTGAAASREDVRLTDSGWTAKRDEGRFPAGGGLSGEGGTGEVAPAEIDEPRADETGEIADARVVPRFPVAAASEGDAGEGAPAVIDEPRLEDTGESADARADARFSVVGESEAAVGETACEEIDEPRRGGADGTACTLDEPRLLASVADGGGPGGGVTGGAPIGTRPAGGWLTGAAGVSETGGKGPAGPRTLEGGLIGSAGPVVDLRVTGRCGSARVESPVRDARWAPARGSFTGGGTGAGAGSGAGACACARNRCRSASI